jgi:sugar phosphate isomerase/epimerase
MKIVLPFFLLILLLGCSAPADEISNPFYAFSNAGNLPEAPEGLDAKARLFKDLGYSGWGGHYGEEDYPARRAALDKAGLDMPEIYWGLNIDSTGQASYKEGLKEAIVDSRDRDLIVSLLVTARAFQENHAEGDSLAVKAIRELAEFAAPYGVRIAVYPHVNVYCETLEHSLRLAEMTKRENVGAIFNLCHLLKKEGEEGWEQKLADAVPHLYMISICGCDSGDTQEMGWERLIQPLGEGSFDTFEVVKVALENGYEGPFGLQCYNIQKDAKEVLSQSMQTWRSYQSLYLNSRKQ